MIIRFPPSGVFSVGLVDDNSTVFLDSVIRGSLFLHRQFTFNEFGLILK